MSLPAIKVVPAPRCPHHGQMHLVAGVDPADGSSVLVFICHGYDGEGCDHLVLASDAGR